MSASQGAREESTPVILPHPACAYHVSSGVDRQSKKIPPDGVPGYGTGFPLQHCDDLTIKIDIDSCILSRMSFTNVLNAFSKSRTCNVKINTSIKANVGSCGFVLQLDDTPINKIVNKKLDLVCSYGIGELSCNDISHRITLLVPDANLWKRTRRNTELEEVGRKMICDLFSKARDDLMAGDESLADTFEQIDLQSLNHIQSIRTNGSNGSIPISNKLISHKSTPQWQLPLKKMQKIAEKLDSLFSEPLTIQSPSALEKLFQDGLNTSPIWVVSQAGSKDILHFSDGMQLPQETTRYIKRHLNTPAQKTASLDRLEMGCSDLIREDNTIKAWMKEMIMEIVYPGLESGPVIIDIAYRFFFMKNRWMVLLPLSGTCARAVERAIKDSSNEDMPRAEEEVDTNPQDTEDEVILTEEIADNVNGMDPSDQYFLEIDDEDEGDGSTANDFDSPSVPAAASNWNTDEMAELLTYLSDEDESDEDSDENISGANYVRESPSELSELAREAESFVSQTQFSAYLRSLALVFSSATGVGCNHTEELERTKATPMRYMFGTEFGNVYTGHPRVRVSNLRSPGSSPPSGTDFISYDGMEYPRSGPVSCVVYACGLKNTNVSLHDNIKPNAVCGLAATTKLILEESDVLEGE